MRPSRRTAAESVNGASTVSALGTKISGSPVRQARYFAVSMAVPPPSPIIRATPSNASRVFSSASSARASRLSARARLRGFAVSQARAANHACGSTTSRLSSNNGLRQATLSNRTACNGWVGIVILYLIGGGVRARSLDIPQDVL
jgi:hypothetical protein